MVLADNDAASDSIGRDNRARRFRRVVAKFVTGVTVVLVDTDQGVHGMTANAFMSVSLSPLMVAVSIANHTRTHALLSRPGTPFSISVLSHDQKLVADAFAGRLDPSALNSPIEWGPHGMVIRDAAAWFCCTREQTFLSGDHTIIIGLVETFAAHDREPLIFYQSAYRLGFTAEGH